RVSELATRFDAMLTVLDEVDRALAVQGGWSNGSSERTSGDVKVTVTERQRVEIAHDAPAQPSEKAEEKQAAAAPAEGADASLPAVPGAPPGAAPSSVSPPVGAPAAGADDKKKKKDKKEKRKSFSFLRRSKSKPS